MKYKNIRSALHNFADSFTSDANVFEDDAVIAYLARRAIRGAGVELTFDLTAGTCTPAELAAEPVTTSVAVYAARFPALLESQNVAARAITHASLQLRFHVDRVSTSAGFPNSSEMPIDCIVTAVDDRGRQHVVHFRRWLLFYDSDPEGPSRRPHSAMR